MARYPSDMQKYKAGYKRNDIICINHSNAYPKKNPEVFGFWGLAYTCFPFT